MLQMAVETAPDQPIQHAGWLIRPPRRCPWHPSLLLIG
ncbi:hypothetical protein SynA1825c_02605 [Synechococcus sp. A18-25c]|nr:hypothetical protein SynA1825c_02605 [Synechococcus sp. A18-25c]